METDYVQTRADELNRSGLKLKRHQILVKSQSTVNMFMHSVVVEEEEEEGHVLISW